MAAAMQTVAQVTYYAHTYDALEPLNMFSDIEIESFTPRAGVNIDYPGATCADVYHWMQVNNLRVFDTKLIGKRNRGRWEGYYRVTFAR